MVRTRGREKRGADLVASAMEENVVLNQSPATKKRRSTEPIKPSDVEAYVRDLRDIIAKK